MNRTCDDVRRASGFALVTALIFLVLLTLVTLAAVRNSGLEARMSGNNATRTEAFESSELARTQVGTLIDANVFSRGWPSSYCSGCSGTTSVPDALFDPDATKLFSSSCGSGQNGFCLKSVPANACISAGVSNPALGNSEQAKDATGKCADVFNPTALDIDMTYSRSLTAGTGTTTLQPQAQLSIFKLYVSMASGSGTAMVAGYEGLGRAAAAGGGQLYFYTQAQGEDFGGAAATANYLTAAVFRDIIRN